MTDIMTKKVLKDRVCAVCGCKFDVKLKKGNVIPEKYFFSKTLGTSLTGKDTEYWECENCSGYIAERVKEWMIKYWGERCLSFNDECACCKAWACYDYLFEEFNLADKTDTDKHHKTLDDIIKECGDDKEEADVIRKIETNPSAFRRGKLIKGNVVEIKYVGSTDRSRARHKHDSKK